MTRILIVLAAVVLAWLTTPARAQVTNIPCNQLPAQTGDTTTAAGSCATTTTKTGGVAFGPLATQTVPCTVAQGCTGDTGTAWAAYTPTITCGGGTTAGSVPTGFFKTIGKTTFVRLILTTTTTTCTGAVLGLPNTSQGGVILSGRESAVNGSLFLCASAASAATCTIFGATGSTSAAINNATYTFMGVYDSL